MILASGLSKRFGGEKLLHPVDGVPMVKRTVMNLVKSGVFHVITVVTRPDLKNTLEGILDEKGIIIVENKNYVEGMSSSIKRGIEILQEIGATDVGIVLGDLPFLKPETVELVYKRFTESGLDAAFPTYMGERGHPFFSKLDVLLSLKDNLKGDVGLKGFFPESSPRVKVVPVHDPGVVSDIDTAQGQ